MYKDRKAVSEVTAFIFLTFLIVTGATSAYIYSKNILDDSIQTQDKNKMENFLKKLDYKLNSSKNFQGETFSIPLTFHRGEFGVTQNKVYYQTLLEFDQTNTTCLDNICYNSINGYERMFINLSSQYNFTNNVTLRKGSYILTFKNLKNVSEFKVYVK